MMTVPLWLYGLQLGQSSSTQSTLTLCYLQDQVQYVISLGILRASIRVT